MDFKEGEVLYFNTPLGWTSFKVVGHARYHICRRMKVKKLKVGHAGTLDPLATGVMIVCTGKATKRIEELLVIDEIELLECNLPEIKVRVVCSKGTYIRALARDIGEALHSGAHLTALERTRVGDVRIEDCLNPLDFKEWIDGQDLVMSDGL